MAAILGVASGRGSRRRLPRNFTPALTFLSGASAEERAVGMHTSQRAKPASQMKTRERPHEAQILVPSFFLSRSFRHSYICHQGELSQFIVSILQSRYVIFTKLCSIKRCGFMFHLYDSNGSHNEYR